MNYYPLFSACVLLVVVVVVVERKCALAISGHPKNCIQAILRDTFCSECVILLSLKSAKITRDDNNINNNNIIIIIENNNNNN